MKIVPIFADSQIPKGLFAICLHPDHAPIKTAYDVFMVWIHDKQKLRSFFKEREHLLVSNRFFPNTVKEATKRTFEEMRQLENELIASKHNSIDNLCLFLRENFKALDNKSSYGEELQPSKTRGQDKDCWIRLYAVRITPKMFIITGGGIKLVKEMKDNVALRNERQKLLAVRQYLKDEGLFDPESYQELIMDI